MEENKNSLLNKLNSYCSSEYYPFHMPGHKRRDISQLTEHDIYEERQTEKMGFPNPYTIDITEIDGFDNLHHAEGILKESMEDAAEIYGADHSYYLVNGSTCGILSAICGCTKNGGKILMARNCHKAAYHGAMLHQLDVEYIYPEYLESYGINGGICVEDVRAALEKNQNAVNVDDADDDCGKSIEKIQAVLIVSPTYEGIVSDVQAIADVAHEYGIPLIVDEAHGSHLPFAYEEDRHISLSDTTETEADIEEKIGEEETTDIWTSKFPKSALECGADVVIQSLHKTLPSFTQTAIMHIKDGYVKRRQIERYLGMFQSSSPSYLFLASMDRCVKFMNEDGREESVQLIVVPNDESLRGYIQLIDRDGNKVNLEDDMVLSTINVAEVQGYDKGDTITLQNMDLLNAEVEVSEIVMNYLGNAIYMTENTYAEYFDEFEANGAYVMLNKGVGSHEEYAKAMGQKDHILSAISVEGFLSNFDNVFRIINMVVVIIITLAAALAFTVLFTLSTTNISERERELATIKVLGFFDREVHLYVNKETLILTTIGILIGMPLGKAFGIWLMSILKMPSIYFADYLAPISYLYAAVMAIIFAFIVNKITDKSLDRIDPVEALKSIE